MKIRGQSLLGLVFSQPCAIKWLCTQSSLLVMFVCKSEIIYSAICGPMQDRVDVGASRIRQSSDRTGGTNVTRAFFKLITSVCRERLVPARQNREKTPQSKASTAPRLIGVGTSSLNLQMRSPAPYNIFKARIKNKSPFHALLRINNNHPVAPIPSRVGRQRVAGFV